MTFYVIDGMDGVGKDSIADMLVEKLESSGRKVSCYKHPSRSTFFGKVAAKSLLKDGSSQGIIRSVSYFLDLLVSSIRKAGDDADDIIFVRYAMSALYLPKPISKYLYAIASFFLPSPDVGILVDVPADIAMERISSRGDEMEVYENHGKLMTVRLDMLYVAIRKGWHILDNRNDRKSSAEMLDNILSSKPSF